MTSLPGTMQIQNLIPMPYFKTTAFAAPVLGTVGGICTFVLGTLWLNRQARVAGMRGEGFSRQGEVTEADVADDDKKRAALPSFGVAMAPIICVFACNFLASEWWIPRWQADYLAEPRFGGVKLSDVRGIWASVISLLVASGLLIVLSARCRERLGDIFRVGALNSLLPVFNVASEVGYGATIASLPAFTLIKNALLNFVPGNPLVSEATAISVLAGITGSASGGLSIALESLGATYYQRGLEFGINPEVMHRVAAMASGGLDSLPHNGAIITLLTICGHTHKQSYLDLGMVTVVVPLISLALVIVLAGV
jgi:H+/gluconate symporter-like permease